MQIQVSSCLFITLLKKLLFTPVFRQSYHSQPKKAIAARSPKSINFKSAILPTEPTLTYLKAFALICSQAYTFCGYHHIMFQAITTTRPYSAPANTLEMSTIKGEWVLRSEGWPVGSYILGLGVRIIIQFSKQKSSHPS